METTKRTILLAALWLAPIGALHADLNSDMQGMFDSLGVLGNYSSPTSFTAQGRGYFVGGGVSVRTPLQSITPVSFDRPSFAAGCGGIDMHLGSISFANLDAYKNFFQALPSAAIGYGLKVGLDAISPTLRKAFDSVEDIVNKINTYAMNSCQAAQAAFTGAVGLIEQTNLERCKQRKLSDGAKDAVEAETQCKKSEGDVADGGSTGPEALKPVKGNVIWKALSKIDGLSRDDKEFVMSIFGTVIIETGKEPAAFAPTIPTFREFFLGKPDPSDPFGSPIGLQIYKCDTVSECLHPTKKFVLITTFPARVEERMKDIANRLLTQQPQNAVNIGFINGTNVPVYRMLTLATATGDASMADNYIRQFKETIAIELAGAYIDKLIGQAGAVMNVSQHTLSTAEKDLMKSIVQIGMDFRMAAREEEKNLAGKAVAMNALQDNLENLQKKIYGDVPENIRRLMMAGR